MGKQERIETFLEIYGNTLVREKTHLFIQQHATDLIK